MEMKQSTSPCALHPRTDKEMRLLLRKHKYPISPYISLHCVFSLHCVQPPKVHLEFFRGHFWGHFCLCSQDPSEKNRPSAPRGHLWGGRRPTLACTRMHHYIVALVTPLCGAFLDPTHSLQPASLSGGGIPPFTCPSIFQRLGRPKK